MQCTGVNHLAAALKLQPTRVTNAFIRFGAAFCLRDTYKRAAARRRQSVASATVEPPLDCKSQWQGHTQESRREGVNRGKCNSRASQRVQITTAGTHTREPLCDVVCVVSCVILSV